MGALNKLLATTRTSRNALFQYGMLSIQQNKIPDAQRFSLACSARRPAAPPPPILENAIRTGKVGSNDLSEARRLAQTDS